MKDYAFQTVDWSKSVSNQPGDLNRYGSVDFQDLSLLIDGWLGHTIWYE